MADLTYRANCPPKPSIELRDFEAARHVAAQIVARDGPAFLPILRRMEKEVEAARAASDQHSGEA